MAKKRSTKKAKTTKRNSSKTSQSNINNTLVENFVGLQKVMVNLSIKLDNLTSQIEELLKLFEISAKSLAKKDFVLEKETKNSQEISKKMETLIDQNKIIARGLTLLHEKESPSNINMPRNPPQISSQPANPSIDVNQYQKSISSPNRFPPLNRR